MLTLGRTELIDKLLEDEAMKAQKSAVEGLEDLRVLFKYLELYGITDKVHALSKDSFLVKKEPVILLFHLIDLIIICRLFLT